KSDIAETARVDHERMRLVVAVTAKAAYDDSIPADIAGSCTRGTRKLKSGELALKQQKSMVLAVGANKLSQNGSQIIERDGVAVSGRRREIQGLKRALPALGECSSGGGGDEKGRHQQTEDFSAASHKINGAP